MIFTIKKHQLISLINLWTILARLQLLGENGGHLLFIKTWTKCSYWAINNNNDLTRLQPEINPQMSQCLHSDGLDRCVFRAYSASCVHVWMRVSVCVCVCASSVFCDSPISSSFRSGLSVSARSVGSGPSSKSEAERERDRERVGRENMREVGERGVKSLGWLKGF